MASRLAEFQIEGLFGLYSHRINLNLKERITIIIGPNGRGKTVCLKFIEALFRKNYTYFADIPYRVAKFTFTGGEKIIVEAVEESGKRSGETAPGRSVRFSLSARGKEINHWTPASIDKAIKRDLRRYVPANWQQINMDLWVDRLDGEELSLSELVERYAIPQKLVSELHQDLPD
jgi:predicted ATP-binding protein involved in virulence